MNTEFKKELQKIASLYFPLEFYVFIHDEPWEIEGRILAIAQTIDNVITLDLRQQNLSDSNIYRLLCNAICGTSRMKIDQYEARREIKQALLRDEPKALVIAGVERLTPKQIRIFGQYCEISHGMEFDPELDELTSDSHKTAMVISCSPKKLKAFQKQCDERFRVVDTGFLND